MEVRFLTSTMRGLFATKSYKKGEIIRVLKGSISDKPDRLSIEIMLNVHVLMSMVNGSIIHLNRLL